MGMGCCMPRWICCTQQKIRCAHPEFCMLLQDQAHTKGLCVGLGIAKVADTCRKQCLMEHWRACLRYVEHMPHLCKVWRHEAPPRQRKELIVPAKACQALSGRE